MKLIAQAITMQQIFTNERELKPHILNPNTELQQNLLFHFHFRVLF